MNKNTLGPMNIQLFADGSETGAKSYTMEQLEAMFTGGESDDTPPATQGQGQPPAAQPAAPAAPAVPPTGTGDSDEKITKIVAARMKAETDKLKAGERNEIAKELGFATWDDYLKDKQAKELAAKGFKPEDILPEIDKAVAERFKNSAEMKELAELRQMKLEAFGKAELAEITKLTGGKVTSIGQLPKEVVDLWRKKGSLKGAFLELMGEKLITEAQMRAASGHSKGSLSHMATLSGSAGSGNPNVRPLTDKEKAVHRAFNPGITEEELAKKTVPV